MTAPTGKPTRKRDAGSKRGRLPVVLLWHQHQPFYRVGTSGDPTGAYLLPWVRLHAVRDYYAMAAMVADYPNVHLTINLVPSMVVQLEDYIENGATDLWMELCLTPTKHLSDADRHFMISRFFDANWRHEIEIYPRYAELLRMRQQHRPFSDADIDDLKAWFNIAWFPPEARCRPWRLHNGEEVCVREFIEKGRGFVLSDIIRILEAQLAVMRNVLPIHQHLSEQGQIEISVTPFYHPILPLLVDTDLATIDAEGATLPPRFSYPQDALAQLRKSADFYRDRFGREPVGLWPSEGSVGEHMVDLVYETGFRWMATDRGVLERSGEHGYETEDPEILLRPYLAGKAGRQVSTFFRQTRLSDDIGFSLQDYADYDRAAETFLGWIRKGFARAVDDPAERVLTLAVDGENAWGSYRNDARAFLRGIYSRLNDDPDLVAVTPSEFIAGDESRGVRAHPADEQYEVSPLFTASWIDEMGSPHGNDLNIWIGSPEENRAWEVLGMVRSHMDEVRATPDTHPEAYESLYAAEGSDWFWWFGDDFVLPQGVDWMFDLLFREHLKNVYVALGEEPPEFLDEPIVRKHVLWTKAERVRTMEPGQLLRIMSDTPGKLKWSLDRWKTHKERTLEPAGDVMANLSGYSTTLGPFGEDVWGVEFMFEDQVGPGSHTVRVVKPSGE
jgi:alpha-amylase/alpha-mannosidase (GH57 family)